VEKRLKTTGIEASTGCLHSALVCVLESMKIEESAAAANCYHCQLPRGCESQPDDLGWLANRA